MKEILNDKTLFKSQCLINGEWVDSDDNKKIEIINPATKECIVKIPSLNIEQVKTSIDAAHEAFLKWKEVSPSDRSKLLRNWYDLIIENLEDLAAIMVTEQGKPLKEAKSEVEYAANYVEFYAEEAKRIYGDVLPSPFPDARVFVIKQPVGVVGIITPWNFPIAMMMRKVAPALAAGCTCVIKPDTSTPLSALAILELAVRAGIPNGVINAVTGDSSKIGDEITSNIKIKKISFTGSTKVGKMLIKKSADTVKRVTMELGGNAPFLIFEDADIDDAIEGLITAKFRNSGQTCVCANRILVHENIREEFLEKFTTKVKNLKVGNGFDGVDIGPLIDQDAIEKIERLVKDALSKGATLHIGGKRHTLGDQYYEPTIIYDVDESMDMFEEEIFGPVASIIFFNSDDEAIEMANNTKYGLASYFYAQDLRKINKVAENLEYGIVGINRGAISSAAIPFGGIKESGMGREGSKYGIKDYLNIKYISISS